MDENKIAILTDLKKSLMNSLHDNLKDVILFGSQLSDSSTNSSDFDILVLVKNRADWKLEREVSDICYDIDLKYGILTDTHILSDADLDGPRGKQPIFIKAIKQGYRA